jgi:hypothetical protein
MKTPNLEQTALDLVARLAPWLAPGPSAFFVARAARAHLDVPLAIALIIAAVIETLGISTVATALRLYDWNQSSLTPAGNLKRGRTLAPPGLLWLSITTGAVYVVVTISLTVVLEVRPGLSTVAPAIFPILAVVGATNLAIRSNQTRRETGDLPAQLPTPARSKAAQLSAHKPDNNRPGTGQLTTPARSQTGQLPGHKPGNNQAPTGQPAHVLAAPSANQAHLDHANRARRRNRAQATADLLDYFDQNPGASHRDAAHAIGRSKSWVTLTLGQLEESGQIRRNGNGIEVLS